MGIDAEMLVAMGADVQSAVVAALDAGAIAADSLEHAIFDDLARATPRAGWIAARTYWKNGEPSALAETLRATLAGAFAVSDRHAIVCSSLDGESAIQVIARTPDETSDVPSVVVRETVSLEPADASCRESERGNMLDEPELEGARWVLVHSAGPWPATPPRWLDVGRVDEARTPCFVAWEVDDSLDLESLATRLRQWWRKQRASELLVVAYHDDLDGTVMSTSASRGWQRAPFEYAWSAAGLAR